MKRRGRQLLTKFFLLVTGGIVVSLIVGGAYFLIEPAFSLEYLFAIPLLMIAVDMAVKFLTSTSLPTRIGKIAVILGVPALAAVTLRILQKLRVKEAVLFPKRLILSILSA